MEWSSRGPPNKRFYEKAEESQLPDILRDCMALFRSEAMFLLLSNFTGLKLHFLAPSEDEPEDKRSEMQSLLLRTLKKGLVTALLSQRTVGRPPATAVYRARD